MNDDQEQLYWMRMEVADLKKALSYYANEENWHDSYSLPYYEGPKFKLIWARQENGWEKAKEALGEF